MRIEARIPNPYDKPHESEQFNTLFNIVQNMPELGHGYLIGNVSVGSKALDALLWTEKICLGLEFKNYGGSGIHIHMTENNWFVKDSNGDFLRDEDKKYLTVKGGSSYATPVEQAKTNHTKLSNEIIKVLGIDYDRLLELGDVPFFLVFNKPVILDSQLNPRNTPWFTVTDNFHFESELRAVLAKTKLSFSLTLIKSNLEQWGVIVDQSISTPTDTSRRINEAYFFFNHASYEKALNAVEDLTCTDAIVIRMRCYYRKGEYSKALNEIFEAKQKGVPEAYYYDGLFSLRGLEGTPKNEERALALFRKAAEKGCKKADAELKDLTEKIQQKEIKRLDEEEQQLKRSFWGKVDQPLYLLQQTILLGLCFLLIAYFGDVYEVDWMTYGGVAALVVVLIGAYFSFFDRQRGKYVSTLLGFVNPHVPRLDNYFNLSDFMVENHVSTSQIVHKSLFAVLQLVFGIVTLIGLVMFYHTCIDKGWTFAYFPLISMVSIVEGSFTIVAFILFLFFLSYAVSPFEDHVFNENGYHSYFKAGTHMLKYLFRLNLIWILWLFFFALLSRTPAIYYNIRRDLVAWVSEDNPENKMEDESKEVKKKKKEVKAKTAKSSSSRSNVNSRRERVNEENENIPSIPEGEPVRVNFDSPLDFEQGSAKLSREQIASVRRLCRGLKGKERRTFIVIEGFTTEYEEQYCARDLMIQRCKAINDIFFEYSITNVTIRGANKHDKAACEIYLKVHKL